MRKNVILVYGSKANIPDGFEAVDVTKPKWQDELPTDRKVLCDRSAYIYAIKALPPERIARTKEEVFSIEEVKKENPPPENKNVAAASFDDVLVSARYNEAAEKHKVWLSTYHVKMINQMLGAGCTVTLLDEDGNVVKELQWEKRT